MINQLVLINNLKALYATTNTLFQWLWGDYEDMPYALGHEINLNKLKL